MRSTAEVLFLFLFFPPHQKTWRIGEKEAYKRHRQVRLSTLFMPGESRPPISVSPALQSVSAEHTKWRSLPFTSGFVCTHKQVACKNVQCTESQVTTMLLSTRCPEKESTRAVFTQKGKKKVMAACFFLSARLSVSFKNTAHFFEKNWAQMCTAGVMHRHFRWTFIGRRKSHAHYAV